MRKVKVRRSELLEKVQANRAKHRETYKKALEVFREEATAKIESMLAKARSGGDIALYVGLTQPEEHTADYDQVIAMLEMSVDDEIELEQDVFSQYVMDRWGWQRSFITNTESYASKSKG